MIWLPWRRIRRDTQVDVEEATEALKASQSDRTVEDLARELERLHRQDNLAPRIAAAFRAHPGSTPQ